MPDIVSTQCTNASAPPCSFNSDPSDPNYPPTDGRDNAPPMSAINQNGSIPAVDPFMSRENPHQHQTIESSKIAPLPTALLREDHMLSRQVRGDMPHGTAPHPPPPPQYGDENSRPPDIIVTDELIHPERPPGHSCDGVGESIPAIDPRLPTPAYSLTWSAHLSTVVAPPTPRSDEDADAARYNTAYGVGVVRRLPEAFPEYTGSICSGRGPPEPLPPYGTNNPPQYNRFSPATLAHKPQTRAELLFKYGFLFPVFWIFGALVLIRSRHQHPLNSNSRWPSNGDCLRWCNQHLDVEEDRIEYMKQFHACERKWARRCLLAIFLLTCFAIAVGATTLGISKATGGANSMPPQSAG